MGRTRLRRVRWLFALDLFVAAVFLIFGNTTGRIIGGALLIALGLLITRGVLGRRSEPNSRAVLLVHRLLALAGLFAIGSGVYEAVAGDAALAVFLLALGAYCLFEARKELRPKPVTSPVD